MARARPGGPLAIPSGGRARTLAWLKGAQFYLHWVSGLAKLLREFQPDIIDLWEEPWGLVSAHACWLRGRLLPNTRIISETEQNVNKRLPPPFEQFRRYVYQRTDFVVCRNTEAQEVVKSKGYQGPMQVCQTRSMRNCSGRWTARVPPGLAGGGSVRVPGGLRRPVGRGKGVLLDLVNALEFCPSTLGLLLVGAGPLRSQLEQRARELGKGIPARFRGRAAMQELPALMNALDVLVLPSRTTPSWKEQFGRVIIEAYAMRGHGPGVGFRGDSRRGRPRRPDFPRGDARALRRRWPHFNPTQPAAPS